MDRPAKSAKKTDWIAYADYLEGADAGQAEALKAANAALVIQVKQAKRALKRRES